MFRAVHADPAGGERLGFYEFMTFVEVDGSIALRIKHFNSDLTGWEEKDKYLTFRREGPDRMTMFLALRSRGELREEVFRMTRQ